MKKVKEEKPALRPEALATADRLHSAAIHLLRRVRKQDATLGIGPTQLSALSVLVFAGPKTLGELAASEQVKPPTMSRVVVGLKRSGLVEISRDPRDGRRMHIQASGKGAELLLQARERRIGDLAFHLATLTDGERTQLTTAIDVLENVLRRWP
jgi:DNA-binding MarR family transcriptional regulator